MRLSSKTKISRLLAHGSRWRFGPLLFCGLKIEEPSRFGVLLSRKHYRHAVERNRINRLLRECQRNLKGKIMANWDILILPQPGIDLKKTKFKEMENWFVGALKKKGLI